MGRGENDKNMKIDKSYNPLFIITAVVIIPVTLALMFFHELESNYIIAYVTFLVGSSAIYLYIKQKDDKKRDSASILLMEIRNAEKIIDQIKGGNIVLNQFDIKLLSSNSWNKYNYLFIEDFDRDELDLVNNFYIQCSIIDNYLHQININTQLRQKSSYIHKTLVELSMTESQLSLNQESNKVSYDIKRDNFIKMISSEGYSFIPDAAKNAIDKALRNIRYVTTSSAGNKLKKIAKLK